MGLSIEVGLLAHFIQHDAEGAEWFREALADINAVLKELNLPTHSEPESLPPVDNRSVVCSFPYSFLHYLHRAYAHGRQSPNSVVFPCPQGQSPAQDPAIEAESDLFDSHLLCHSVCEGFYLPLDFSDVIMDSTGRDRISGGLLGSSYRLHEELIEMAPCLGIRDAATLSDAAVEEIRQSMESETDLWIEKCVWLTLYEACRLSKQHGTAICFA
jgi:hypothetical protein